MNLYPNLARMLYDACRRDVCLHYNDKAFVHRLACGYVEQMAIECLHRGLNVKNFRYHCSEYLVNLWIEGLMYKKIIYHWCVY